MKGPKDHGGHGPPGLPGLGTSKRFEVAGFLRRRTLLLLGRLAFGF